MSATSPIIVVTGANRGVGLEIARAIAAKSSPQVIYASSRSGANLHLKAQSPSTSIQYVKLDVSDPQSIAGLVERVRRDHGELDVLINNAGVNLNYEESLSSSDRRSQTLAINYIGTVTMTRSVLPLMRRGGRIVNLSSVASHLGKFGPTLSDAFRSATAIEDVDALMDEFEQASQEGTAKSAGWPDPYSVSKAGINAATRVFAKENPGIAVNCCCPGWCSSDMGSLLGRPPKTPAEGAVIPLKLAFGDIGGVSGEFWEEPSISSKGDGRVSTW